MLFYFLFRKIAKDRKDLSLFWAYEKTSGWVDIWTSFSQRFPTAALCECEFTDATDAMKKNSRIIPQVNSSTRREHCTKQKTVMQFNL